MSVFPPAISAVWQTLAHAWPGSAATVDFAGGSGTIWSCPRSLPSAAVDIHARTLSPFLRSGHLWAGPVFRLWQSLADAEAPRGNDGKFTFRRLLDQLNCRAITTQTRGSQKCLTNPFFLPPFWRLPLPAAWQHHRNVVLSARLQALRLLMQQTRTSWPVAHLAHWRGLQAAAFPACQPAADLTTAASRGPNQDQRPSGAMLRVAFSHLAPRPGRNRGRETCSRKS